MALASAARSPRTGRLLTAPLLPTLVALAAPGVVVMVVQAAVVALDAHYVGWLGRDALAGVSLVFPLFMLMQTMSAGGMGGGVSSAVARALGAGRRSDAERYAAHAVVIALGMAALFTLGFLAAGPALYRAMGGQGAVLDAARAYSSAIFGGAAAYWLFNTLANVVRGTGQMVWPAAVVVGTGGLYAALAPALILGAGPVPRLGVAGAGVASVTAFTLGTLVLAGYLRSPASLVRLSFVHPLRRDAFREILRVGGPGALNTVFTNLTVVLLTGLVGPFGAPALAGYGLGARLEYLLIPIVFGLGTALVTLVGTSVGAGDLDRARRAAWLGAGLAAAITGTIGMGAALAPDAWLGLFSDDLEVLAAGRRYLRMVGPTYACFGFGLALYFASQGAGRLLWPLAAGAIRLSLAAGGGWLAIDRLGAGLDGLFGAMAVALVVYGLTLALAVHRWARSRRPTRDGGGANGRM
jgi:putative MATE family efflux protein